MISNLFGQSPRIQILNFQFAGIVKNRHVFNTSGLRSYLQPLKLMLSYQKRHGLPAVHVPRWVVRLFGRQGTSF